VSRAGNGVDPSERRGVTGRSCMKPVAAFGILIHIMIFELSRLFLKDTKKRLPPIRPGAE